VSFGTEFHLVLDQGILFLIDRVTRFASCQRSVDWELSQKEQAKIAKRWQFKREEVCLPAGGLIR
jgi:hypothetical protein